jgi:basic membrane protein A
MVERMSRPVALATVTAAALLAVAIATASADSKRQVRVGLVLSQPLSRANDPGEYAAYRGLLRAKRQLGVQVKAVVPNPSFPFDPAPFDYLAAQGYDLVIASGNVGGLSEAGRRFPNVKFAAEDAFRGQLQPAAPANVAGTVFHAEQAAYLAGFVAARVADRGPKPHVVSSVGGFAIPQVQALIAGFRAGARRADPKIGLRNAYAESFSSEPACRNVALDQISHGSQVVFDVAGACGVGALEAAKQKGVYGVGVDTDQSWRGRFILTSAVLNWGLGVYTLAKLAVQGRLRTGGNLSWDMRHHFVGLGKFSPKVSLSVRRQLEPLAAQIAEGRIVVPTTFNARH